MKNRHIVLLTAATFLWSACSSTEPTLKDTQQIVTLENGKSYSIPVGTNYTKEPVTKGAIQFYTDMGVKDCNYGDITWEETQTAEHINKIIRDGAKEKGIAVYKKAASEGKIGCSSPVVK